MVIRNEILKTSLNSCFRPGQPRKLVVALSGGVDSMCLTWLLTQYRDNHDKQLQIYAVTVDHKYRQNSQKEAQEIGKLVSGWGVTHFVESLTYDRPLSEIANFEEVARWKRLEKFEEVCKKVESECLFVGHNLDDQLETYLYRLSHKSSLFGLLGLSARAKLPKNSMVSPNLEVAHAEQLDNEGLDTEDQDIKSADVGPSHKQSSNHKDIFVYRPLLSVLKSDIINHCKSKGIIWFEDISNLDIKLTERNMIRHILNKVAPHNSDYKHISKPVLIQTCKEVRAMVDLIEDKAQKLIELLYGYHMVNLDERNGNISLIIPSKFFVGDNQLILSRMMYKLLSRVSSLKHYHWAYAKIERNLVPRIAKCQGSTIKLTILNLSFDVKLLEDAVSIGISRQPMLREDIFDNIYEIPLNVWSSWITFDRRYLLRVKALPHKEKKISPEMDPVLVVPYVHGKFEAHPLLGELNKSMNYVPVVVKDNVVISVPSYKLSVPWVFSECHLKG